MTSEDQQHIRFREALNELDDCHIKSIKPRTYSAPACVADQQ